MTATVSKAETFLPDPGYPKGHPHWKVAPACMCKSCEANRGACGCGRCSGCTCMSCAETSQATALKFAQAR